MPFSRDSNLFSFIDARPGGMRFSKNNSVECEYPLGLRSDPDWMQHMISGYREDLQHPIVINGTTPHCFPMATQCLSQDMEHPIFHKPSDVKH